MIKRIQIDYLYFFAFSSIFTIFQKMKTTIAPSIKSQGLTLAFTLLPMIYPFLYHQCADIRPYKLGLKIFMVEGADHGVRFPYRQTSWRYQFNPFRGYHGLRTSDSRTSSSRFCPPLTTVVSSQYHGIDDNNK